MSRTPDQKSLVTLIARTGSIALIAMVLPLGVDISGDGVLSFGASFSNAANEGEGNGHGGKSNNGKGNNGIGNGGEASQGEAPDDEGDPSNPGRGHRGGCDGGGDGGGDGG